MSFEYLLDPEKGPRWKGVLPGRPEPYVLRRGEGEHAMLFTDRNAALATWIRNRLARDGTVFIAVGAGHLAGRDSVIADLHAQGIQAARLPHVARP